MLFAANVVYPILALTAMYLLAHKMKSAFIIFLFVEILMAYIGIVSEQYGILAMALMYFFMNIYSYIKWSKAE